MKTICILGLGYIGLPTACILGNTGYKVFGIDISEKVVESINKKYIYIEEPGLEEAFTTAVKSGNLNAFTTPQEADIFIIAVPTPITADKKADLSCVKSAAESIFPVIKKGDLIIVESTCPPRTTKDIVLPILEKSGLQAGRDFLLAYCPERVLPGNILKELRENSRIVGGINEVSAQKAKEVYSSFVKGDIYLTDSITAETVKVMENTFRDVNIALANELAKISDHIGVNCWEVIKYANLHPRVNIHAPGPGVGGHCISVDPWFMVEKAPQVANLIRQARGINDSMPEFTYNMILEQVKHIKNPKITVLGITYKPDVDDIRESPALEIAEMVQANSDLRLAVHDPHVKSDKYKIHNLQDALEDSDCIVLLVNHAEFKNLNPEFISKIVKNKLIIDTRNILNRSSWKKHGFKYVLLGKNNNLKEKTCSLSAL